MKTLTFILIALLGIQGGNPVPATLGIEESAAMLEAPGSGKMLTDWMNMNLLAIRNCTVSMQHFRPLGYIGISLYESLVAGDAAYRSLAGQLNDYNVTPAIPATKDFCWQASANANLAETFRYFYSDNPVTLHRIDSLEQSISKQLISLGFSDAAVHAGAVYGKNTAQNIIAWSKTDGADQANAPYTLPKGPGLYELTPPVFKTPINPYLGKCRTFVKGSIDGTAPPPPVAFSEDPGSPFYTMVNEVYQTSLEHNPEKIATALFWDDFPDGKTVTAGGHWESILETVIKQNNLSLIESSRVYAELFITMCDASIGCFKAKYTYNVMRPVTYIQKYMKQSDWNPVIVTPAHPEYPAAHAVVSMSAATILTRLLGNQVNFTDNTYYYRTYKEHHFNNFTEAGTEAGMSRLYGGIHYLPSIKAGFDQGSKVANNIAKALVFKKS